MIRLHAIWIDEIINDEGRGFHFRTGQNTKAPKVRQFKSTHSSKLEKSTSIMSGWIVDPFPCFPQRLSY